MAKIGREEFERKLEAKTLSKQEIQLVMLAYRFSKYGHREQKRDSGERYFEHPKRVTLVLMDELRIYRSEILIAALLHDIKEESFILNWEDIKLIFGEGVYETISALTKDKSLPKELRDWKYVLTLARADRDITLIKLADRLDNLRTLEGCSKAKQREFIKETQEIYLPLAQEISLYLFEEMQKIIKYFGFINS